MIQGTIRTAMIVDGAVETAEACEDFLLRMKSSLQIYDILYVSILYFVEM